LDPPPPPPVLVADEEEEEEEGEMESERESERDWGTEGMSTFGRRSHTMSILSSVVGWEMSGYGFVRGEG
jgi:hypothetical protein